MTRIDSFSRPVNYNTNPPPIEFVAKEEELPLDEITPPKPQEPIDHILDRLRRITQIKG